MDTAEGVKQRTKFAIDAVLFELKNAVRRYPVWPDDPVTASAIVAEEAGELIQAALDVHWHKQAHKEDNMIDEAIQTAAMAIRFIVEYTGH